MAVARRLRPFGETVFAEFTRLAVTHDAINLGQGFPNFDGPDFVKDAAAAAIAAGNNQYARSYGLSELTEAIARRLNLLDERISLYGVREFLTGALERLDRTGGLHEDTRARVKRFLRESEPGAIVDDPDPSGGHSIDAPGIASPGRRDDPVE